MPSMPADATDRERPPGVEITIRPARPADAPAMARLLRASITELCGLDHGQRPEVLAAWLANKTPAGVAAWLDDPANLLLVARRGGAGAAAGGNGNGNGDGDEDPPELAGVAALRVDGAVGLVGLNYVAPAHRFQGVSKAMLGALEDLARQLGLGALRLDSTATARALYRSAGFVERGPPASKHGLVTYPLIKPLALPAPG